MGIMYISAILVITAHRLYPSQMRHSTIAGLLLMCFSLAMSSFSTTTSHLIATQGVLYAVGGAIAYIPCIMYMPEWFVNKQGLSFGIMWSGTGLAGVFFPFFLEALLRKCGFCITLRIWSRMLFALTAPLAWFVKPRIPIQKPSSSGPSTARRRPLSLRFVKSKVFALHQLANVIEALGFFLPGIYLPTYASSMLGANDFVSAMTVMLLTVASVFGCVAMGAVIDRLDVTSCIGLSSLGATIGTLVIWGLATNIPTLYVFCIIYGFFAGSYTSTWPGIMRAVAQHDADARREVDREADSENGDEDTSNRAGTDPIMVFGMLAAGRGVGNVVSGPLSEALVRGATWRESAAAGYGSGYGLLIAFTGVSALLGEFSVGWKRVGWV